jgi:hypothetical protein
LFIQHTLRSAIAQPEIRRITHTRSISVTKKHNHRLFLHQSPGAGVVGLLSADRRQACHKRKNQQR